jgi:hypothetical protein
MKDKLIQILGLKPGTDQNEVSDAQILNQVTCDHLAAGALERSRLQELEITNLVKQSGNSLSRATAKEVLENRAAHAKLLAV